MDLAVWIAVTAAAANLTVAAMQIAVSRAPRRRGGQLLASIALTAALYNALSVVFCIGGFSDTVYLAAGRAAYLVATVHLLLWIVYAYSGPEPSIRTLAKPIRWLVVSVSSIAVFAAITGILLKDAVAPVHIPWANVSYHYPVASTAGDIYGLAAVGLTVLVLFRLFSRYRRGERRLRSHLLCFGLFLACALEEVLVANRMLTFLSLLDAGFLLVVMPLSWQTARGIIEDARQLEALTHRLGDEVVRRTSERDSARQTLAVTERHVSESEERFQQVAESAGVFVWEVDAEGLYTYASPYIEKMLGYSPDELVGKLHFYDLFPPGSREELKAAAEQVMQHRDKFDGFINPAVAKGGRFVLLETTGVPLVDADGKLTGYRGSDRDVTDRRRADVALRESRATVLRQLHEIEAIYAGAPVGLCVIDSDLRFQRINERLAEINGLTVDEHLGRTVREVLPELAPVIEPLYRKVLETGESIVDIEIRGATQAHPGVERVWLASFYPLHALGGDYAGINVVVQDITERKRAEAALAESEERFRSVADCAPVIIWLTDAAGNATFFNQQATLFTGLDSQQLGGRDWLDLVHPEDSPRALAALEGAIEGRSSAQVELRVRRADGQYRWMLATGIPRFAGAEFAGHIGTVTDITGLKEEQEHVLATQKLESMGVLAGGIAHDFNNLLGGILAGSELLAAEVREGSAAREGVDRIHRDALRASEIVRELTAYAGREVPEFKSVDLGRLVSEMAPSLRAALSGKARLDLALDGDLPPVRANAAQLRQAVRSLVTNAAESLGDRQGVIRIAASRAAEATASDRPADANPLGGYVRLEISDTGCGMSEQLCSRMFDPFFTTKFPGRGLGLAAVQGIVRLHGGTIQVASTPDVGTQIGILLPVATEPSQEEPPPAAVDCANVEPCRQVPAVLMIEDEESLRSAVCAILRKNGLLVFEAADGGAAVEAFRAHHAEIGAVLLDLTLPGLGGREILVALRQIRPDVKVIVTTAHSRETAVSALDGEDTWSFMRKPYRVADLVQMLRQTLD